MKTPPVYAAACPCCSSTLVVLARASALAPLGWQCAYCGFSMMGLAVPVRPTTHMYSYAKRLYTCLEVMDVTG